MFPFQWPLLGQKWETSVGREAFQILRVWNSHADGACHSRLSSICSESFSIQGSIYQCHPYPSNMDTHRLCGIVQKMAGIWTTTEKTVLRIKFSNTEENYPLSPSKEPQNKPCNGPPMD